MKEIPLHGARAAGRVALVDDEDYMLVSEYRWRIWEAAARPGHGASGPYAVANYYKANGRRSVIKMHKLLTGNVQTDHVNGNGLDNRRENLRKATGSQNGANRKGWGKSNFLGVDWQSDAGKWRARVKKFGVRRSLGLFATEEAAALAYDEAAREIHGEFARLNFPTRGVV